MNTQQQFKIIQNESFEFGHILSAIASAHTRATVLMNEKSTSSRTKFWIKSSIVNRLDATKKDLLTRVSPETAASFKEDLLTADNGEQFINFRNIFMSLIPQDRDIVEQFMSLTKFPPKDEVFLEYLKAMHKEVRRVVIKDLYDRLLQRPDDAALTLQDLFRDIPETSPHEDIPMHAAQRELISRRMGTPDTVSTYDLIQWYFRDKHPMTTEILDEE